MSDQSPVILFAFVGIVFVALGIQLKHEKVPPNWFYGFRTRRTLSDTNIWYAVNRVTGEDMILAGVVLTATAVLMLALRNWIAPEAAVFVLVAVILIMVGWMAYHGLSTLRRM